MERNEKIDGYQLRNNDISNNGESDTISDEVSENEGSQSKDNSDEEIDDISELDKRAESNGDGNLGTVRDEQSKLNQTGISKSDAEESYLRLKKDTEIDDISELDKRAESSGDGNLGTVQNEQSKLNQTGISKSDPKESYLRLKKDTKELCSQRGMIENNGSKGQTAETDGNNRSEEAAAKGIAPRSSPQSRNIRKSIPRGISTSHPRNRPGAFHIPRRAPGYRRRGENARNSRGNNRESGTPVADLVYTAEVPIVVAVEKADSNWIRKICDRKVHLGQLGTACLIVILSVSLCAILILHVTSSTDNDAEKGSVRFDQSNNETSATILSTFHSPIPSSNHIPDPSSQPTFNPSKYELKYPMLDQTKPPTYVPSMISTDPSANPTFHPSVHPTFKLSAYPTYLPSLIPSEVTILSPSTAMEIFVPLSGEKSLKNITSPQYLAMDWIVNHDGANMTLREVDKIIQRYTLAVFYYSTQGKNWKHQYNFLSNKDVCEWKGPDFFNELTGVQKCNKAGHVEQIELFFENLTGTIPSELGLLTELKDLNFARNNLSGKIPVSLSTIPTLTEVDLIRNDLTGSMEHFCTNDIEYEWLSADCLIGNKTKVQCSCCHACAIIDLTNRTGNNRFLED